MYKFLFPFSIVLTLVSLIVPFSVNAQAGAPLPECFSEINPQFYFDKYIDNDQFKSLHPTFDEWEILQTPSDYTYACKDKGEYIILTWKFALPESLSQYNLSYRYTIYLVANWDNTARFAHKILPEEVIMTAESLPEVKEFLNKYADELRQDAQLSYISARGGYNRLGRVSPLELSYFVPSVRGSLIISSKDLPIMQSLAVEEYQEIQGMSNTVRNVIFSIIILMGIITVIIVVRANRRRNLPLDELG